MCFRGVILMHKSVIGCCLAALGAVVVGGGCGGGYLSDQQAADLARVETPEQISVRKDVQFADIPVPYEFIIRRGDSNSFQGSAMRFGKLVYDGIWNTFNTSQWYMKEMPASGWRLVDTKYPNDYAATHVFSKEDETAVIKIYRHEGNTRVEIDINEKIDELEVRKAKAIAAARKNMVAEPQVEVVPVPAPAPAEGR